MMPFTLNVLLLVPSPPLLTNMSTSSNNNDSTSLIVKFVPFASTVESSFWVRYCQEKLDTIQLSEEPVDISAFYSMGSGNRLQLQETCLENKISENKERIVMNGTLIGMNTLEAFQQVDKNELVRTYMQPFNESKLTSFLLLTYADLKNHKILYWFSMPALLAQRFDSSNKASFTERQHDGRTSPDVSNGSGNVSIGIVYIVSALLFV